MMILESNLAHGVPLLDERPKVHTQPLARPPQKPAAKVLRSRTVEVDMEPEQHFDDAAGDVQAEPVLDVTVPKGRRGRQSEVAAQMRREREILIQKLHNTHSTNAAIASSPRVGTADDVEAPLPPPEEVVNDAATEVLAVAVTTPLSGADADSVEAPMPPPEAPDDAEANESAATEEPSSPPPEEPMPSPEEPMPSPEEPSSPPSGESVDDIAFLSVSRLKRRCRSLGLAVTGRKDELVARLVAAAAAGEVPENEPEAE